jgi:hypothetical protein
MRIDGTVAQVPALLWLLLLIWLSLMFLPRSAVMWGLVVLAVGAVISRWDQIAS